MIALLCSLNLNGGQNEENIPWSVPTSNWLQNAITPPFLVPMALISGLMPGKCPQIKHNAHVSKPFIASELYITFSQNWFRGIYAARISQCNAQWNWSLGKTKSWEQPEAGEMHILVTVIGKNIHGNDTIINNQAFYPIFVPNFYSS